VIRTHNLPLLALAAVAVLLLDRVPGVSQSPDEAVQARYKALTLKLAEANVQGQVIQAQKVASDQPDEAKAILGEIREAYKAPLEVDEDVLKELRRSYQQPSEQRENKILSEIRRLYVTTPESERAILRELRTAYHAQTAEQEARVFQEIRRLGQLPPGTVNAQTQASQTEKLFRRLDQNGDGRLSGVEATDFLRSEWGRWDANRDGVIDFQEYQAYYQAGLKTLSAKVATGEIDLKLPPGVQFPKQPAAPAEEKRPLIFRAGKLPAGLPDWFAQLDKDNDAQVGLYEWRKGGGKIDEFTKIDRNGDGHLTVEETLYYIAQQGKAPANGTAFVAGSTSQSGEPDSRATKEMLKHLKGTSHTPPDGKPTKHDKGGKGS
jgi:hypothetical protein